MKVVGIIISQLRDSYGGDEQGMALLPEYDHESNSSYRCSIGAPPR